MVATLLWPRMPLATTPADSTAPTDMTPPTAEYSQTLFHYNPATVSSAQRVYIPGYFSRDLTARELRAMTPTAWGDYSLSCSGIAGFDGEGALLDVNLTLPISVGGELQVVMAPKPIVQDCVLDTEPVTSVYNGVTYTLYEMTVTKEIRIEATATIQEVYYRFKTTATAENVTAVKADFQRYLMDFSANRAQLNAVVADSIPEWFEHTLTYAAALEDKDFGRYMLRKVPAGFKAESIRRYKDYRFDYLSALWSKGLSDISWRVSRYDEERDASRVTAVAEVENYDLSLYPIPRADSVPEELWAVVDNPIFDAGELTLAAVTKRAYRIEGDGGTRMMFSVRYGDILVEINTEGVEPAWLYERLTELK